MVSSYTYEIAALCDIVRHSLLQFRLDETRKISFGVLTVVSLLGSLTILGLRNVPQILEDEDNKTDSDQIEEAEGDSRFGESVEQMSKWAKAKKEAGGALSHSWKLMKTKDIICQSFMWVRIYIDKWFSVGLQVIFITKSFQRAIMAWK